MLVLNHVRILGFASISFTQENNVEIYGLSVFRYGVHTGCLKTFGLQV